MGLDGISINQLRNTQELTKNETTSITRTDSESKQVLAMNKGAKVDPDNENKNDPYSTQDNQDETENKQEIDDNYLEEEVFKYDLSKSGKYMLSTDENDNILIIEKASNITVQKISADKLSKLVGFLSNSQGSIINRKL